MAATTPLSTRCSTESGRAFILDPARSRLLLIWFLGVHALAAAALLTLDVGAGLETVLLAALAA
ncbi:MAG TPA: hypothetical protein VLD39_07200, partial [Gammaproteobacteria bacterium]|nr:hypothetical protein [Gammaproteobacteria bacterium]